MTPTSATSTTATSPRVGAGRLARAAALGTVVALVLVAVIYVVALAVGDDLVVQPPGQAAGRAPLAGALAGTTVGGVLAWLGALVARATPRPRAFLISLAVLACLVSFASPFGASSTTSTAVWLSVMHVAVLICVVPPLARALPAER